MLLSPGAAALPPPSWALVIDRNPVSWKPVAVAVTVAKFEIIRLSAVNAVPFRPTALGSNVNEGNVAADAPRTAALAATAATVRRPLPSNLRVDMDVMMLFPRI